MLPPFSICSDILSAMVFDTYSDIPSDILFHMCAGIPSVWTGTHFSRTTTGLKIRPCILHVTWVKFATLFIMLNSQRLSSQRALLFQRGIRTAGKIQALGLATNSLAKGGSRVGQWLSDHKNKTCFTCSHELHDTLNQLLNRSQSSLQSYSFRSHSCQIVSLNSLWLSSQRTLFFQRGIRTAGKILPS